MHKAKTHTILGGLIAAALVAMPALPGSAAVKKIAYPEVKVTLNTPYKPDAAFEKMHAALLDAIKRKDAQAADRAGGADLPMDRGRPACR